MKNITYLVAMISLAIMPLLAIENDEIIFSDFEGEDYGLWTSKGTAFGTSPATESIKELKGIKAVSGKKWASSVVNGLASQGELISPEFDIENNYISFMVKGSRHVAKTRMCLEIDGKEVRSATKSSRDNTLTQCSWDVIQLKGERARIKIIDATEYEAIHVDLIVFSEKAKGKFLEHKEKATRELCLSGNMVLLPIRKKIDGSYRLTITVDNELVHSVDGEWAYDPEQVMWWAHLDVSEYKGKNATLVTEAYHAQDALSLIESSDEERHLEPLYQENMRPQFHFSQKQGWCNDLNGMNYQDGEYHFSWQSNPVSVDWNNMYWGKAVSKDMIYWEELPCILRPNGGQDTSKNLHPSMAVGRCFSGSGNSDKHNHLGVQENDNKTFVAAYTDTSRGECLAYSTFR